MNKNQNKVTNNSNKNPKTNCKNNKKNFGLANYTYADYVILSSTLAYAIAEELNDEDLDFILIFLSQVAADLALLRTKRGYDEKLKQSDKAAMEESDNSEILEDIIVNDLGRKNKKKTKRKIKKRLKVK